MNTKTFFSVSLAASLSLFSQTVVHADEIVEPTGLNQIHDIIDTDARLQTKVTPENRALAHQAVTNMNAAINEAIKAQGLANDGFISVADTRDINLYLVDNYASDWYRFRGENLGTESTGYYTVDKKGARTLALGSNAVALWGQLYDLGFPATGNRNNRLTNYEGNKASSFKTVGYSLGEIIQQDVDSGVLNNADFQEFTGTTQTALDSIIEAILTDEGLIARIPTSDIRAGAEAADAMNQLIIEAIIEEGLANDGRLSTADIRQINQYLVANHLEAWSVLHGDDEDGEETGFHLVQNDGAYARMFADNVVNSVADGIYHLGFATDHKNRLLNEDGDKNKRFEKVAWWLDTILKPQLDSGALNNNDYQEVQGTTNTSFDKIVPYIYNNEGLLLKVSMTDIRAGAAAANGMNELLVEAIRETGVASDDFISAEEVGTLNEYLVSNHVALWAELHGDDENDEETGYHLVQNDGARGTAYGRNVINQLADSVFHLGFATPYNNRLANEDGDKNASFRKVSYWLNKSLQTDYAAGVLK